MSNFDKKTTRKKPDIGSKFPPRGSYHNINKPQKYLSGGGTIDGKDPTDRPERWPESWR